MSVINKILMNNYSYEIKILNQLNVNFKSSIEKLYIFGNKGCELLFVTKHDGIYAIGDNRDGTLGLGHNEVVEIPTPLNELLNHKIVDFTTGLRHIIIRTDEHKIFCWGNNWWGQLGNGTRNYNYKPEFNEFLSDKNIIDICCGSYHSLALSRTGQVYGWGWNIRGQIGIESDDWFEMSPIVVNGFGDEKVVKISCGYWHSIALTESGCVYCWGDNTSGQLGFKYNKILNMIKYKVNKVTVPKLLKINAVVKKISCGSFHNLLLSSDGDIFAFGRNYFGQVGNGNYENVCVPTKIFSNNKFLDIVSHSDSDISAALSVNGYYYVWGKCGDNTFNIPQEVKFHSFNDVFLNFLNITYKPINFIEEFDGDSLEKIKKQNGKYMDHFNEFCLISFGSFGIVSKARSIGEDKCYAIKKIALNNDMFEKVFQELKMMFKLRSEFIVKITSTWTEDNHYRRDGYKRHKNLKIKRDHPVFDPENNLLLYIQMELCFKTLKEIIEQLNDELNQKICQMITPIGYYIASEIFIEILEGVNYLHKQNPPIIHRDLKPNNILITYGINGRFTKIGDFGLAKIHEFDDQSHTERVGTFKYMAPEVFSRKYDTKADIYSLGVIIQELFNFDIYKFLNKENKFKFKDKYKNLFELMDKMMKIQKEFRPNCDKILNKKSLWVLNMSELKNDKKFKEIIHKSDRVVEIEQNFHSFFILKKFKLEAQVK